MYMESARVDQVMFQLVDRANANETHVHPQFILLMRKYMHRTENQKPALNENQCHHTHSEDLECLLDTVLSVRTERVHERASDTDSRSTRCDRLEDVA